MQAKSRLDTSKIFYALRILQTASKHSAKQNSYFPTFSQGPLSTKHNNNALYPQSKEIRNH